MFLEEGIKFEAKFGDGSEPKQSFWKKLLAAGGRILTGESLFVTHFTNEGQRKARVAFAAPYPGNIVPLNLANLGGSIICQRDAFLCAALGTKISIAFNKRIGSGLFGGEGKDRQSEFSLFPFCYFLLQYLDVARLYFAENAGRWHGFYACWRHDYQARTEQRKDPFGYRMSSCLHTGHQL